jgi:hypothetical protein
MLNALVLWYIKSKRLESKIVGSSDYARSKFVESDSYTRLQNLKLHIVARLKNLRSSVIPRLNKFGFDMFARSKQTTNKE